MSTVFNPLPLRREAKGHIDPVELNRHNKVFEGYGKSEVNEVLCAIVENRFSTVYRLEDHRAWVANTVGACKGRYGQDSTDIGPLRGSYLPQAFTASLYLPTDDTPRNEHLVMTRSFQGVQIYPKHTVSWYSNTDEYHESGGTRTVKVSTKFNSKSRRLMEFELESADKDSLKMITERKDGIKVATVTYTDRNGNDKVAIPPAFLQPIQSWAEWFGYTIETPNIAEGSVAEDIASAAE